MAYYTGRSFDPHRNNIFPQPANNPYHPLRSELSSRDFEDHAPQNVYPGFYCPSDGSSLGLPLYASWSSLVEQGFGVISNLGHSPTLATEPLAQGLGKTEVVELIKQSVPIVLLATIDDKEFVLKIFPRTINGRARYKAEKSAYINLTRYASCEEYPQPSSRFPWPECYGILKIPVVIPDNPTSWATVGHGAIGGTAAPHVPRGTVSVIPPEGLMQWLPDYFCLTGVAPVGDSPTPSRNSSRNGGCTAVDADGVPRRTCSPLFFHALVLEYLPPSWYSLTPSTLTPARARASLAALTTIHAALVLHNDFQSEQDDCYQFRNIMVRGGGAEEAEAEVVWIDFDHAEAFISKAATPKFTQYMFREEGFLVWDTFWNYILPSQMEVYYEPGVSAEDVAGGRKKRWTLCAERINVDKKVEEEQTNEE